MEVGLFTRAKEDNCEKNAHVLFQERWRVITLHGEVFDGFAWLMESS